MVKAAIAAGLGGAIDPVALLAQGATNAGCPAPGSSGAPPGELLGTLRLFRGDSQPQAFGVKYGGPGLDARMVTDLSALEPGGLITPNKLAFIRTEIPRGAAEHVGPWTIKISGLADGAVQSLPLAALAPGARPKGAHLFECSGNANPSHFGLMSVAEWDGISLADVVRRYQPSPDATGVLVTGVDHSERGSGHSAPGASWVFPLRDLDTLGAFLAVRMNGEPLPADHGKPVRLVVPGWYGCTWTKWVNEIRFVGPGEPATAQMIEFAGRTHQSQAHAVAADYSPADIQTAAMPVRVEKRRGTRGIEYRIVGIVWGGRKAVDRLAIRVRPTDAFEPFSICPVPSTPAIWSLWEYRWRPSSPGLYEIALRVPDSTVPQRRLDRGYYTRHVQVEDV